MAHGQTRDELIELANANGGDPMGFLEGLSPIHDGWHGLVRTYGFLLFHHRVVRYVKAIVNPNIAVAIVPFADAEFVGMGGGGFVPGPLPTSLAELEAFSQNIEAWHNNQHRLIGVATGVPMMDASQNIFFRPFWQLHFYIDDHFQDALNAYEAAAHPGMFLDPTAIAAHIEVGHHGWVRSI